jgi:hypothetical protein
MSPDWEDLFPLVTVRKLVREVSDHNALLLDTGSHAITVNASKEFCFDFPGSRMWNSFILWPWF